MLNQSEQSAVIGKTQELCQTILDQPGMVSARQRIEAFLGDESARSQYQNVVTKGQELQQKQQTSTPLSDQEIAEFESSRDQLMQNPIAKGFLDAQEQMRELHHSVNKFVSMTLESGRVPTTEDFEAATCGNGCSCGHEH